MSALTNEQMTPEQIKEALIQPYLDHALRMFESGYATSADIDAAMRFGCGYPTGPMTVLAENGRVLPDSDAAAVQAPELQHEIRTVGVVGTGTMASGIVQVFAQAGFNVVYVGRGEDKVAGVRASIEKSLDKAISRGKLEESGKADVLGRLIGATEREALADVDIVVEAIAEDLEIKLELFRDLDRICLGANGGRGAILATTTSSLPITECAKATSRPEWVIGMHFFNPAVVMKLVEVVTTDLTSAEVDETVRALCEKVGKVAVSCGDRSGFIVNCLLFPYLNDAVKLLESGAATTTEIDGAIKEHAGFPMGPFELLDVVGNDVSLAIQKELYAEFGVPGFEPAATLVQVVADGHLGRKSGKGFHDYS